MCKTSEIDNYFPQFTFFSNMYYIRIRYIKTPSAIEKIIPTYIINAETFVKFSDLPDCNTLHDFSSFALIF